MNLLKLQRAVEARKGDEKYCQEALADLEYGLSLASERALSHFMRCWIDSVAFEGDHKYQFTIQEIWEEVNETLG